MSPRGNEVVPQGREMLQRQMSRREAQLCSRTTRERPQGQNRRLWLAVAREAKSQTHLLHAGRAVPQLFREGGTHQRRDRRYAVTAARAAFGQCGVSPWFRDFPPPGAAVGAPRPRCGERSESEYSALPGERGRGARDSRRQPQAANPGDCEGGRRPPERTHVAGHRSRQLHVPRAGAAKWPKRGIRNALERLSETETSRGRYFHLNRQVRNFLGAAF